MVKVPHVQNLIKATEKQKMIISKSFAVQFRDYLMTIFAIENGLRPSNLITLSIKDMENAKKSKVIQGTRS